MFFVLDFIVHYYTVLLLLYSTVVVHNKNEHEKHLLRTVVLIKVLVDTRATGCITQQLSLNQLALLEL
jgi:hypothetical protein